MNARATGTATRSIQARVMTLVALGVVTSMLVPGWVAWRSLDELATQAVTAREADASLAAHHIEGVLAREWNKLQEIAAAPAPEREPEQPTTAGFAPRPELLRDVYFRSEIMERTFVTDSLGRLAVQEPASTEAVGQEVPGARAVIATGRPGVSPYIAAPQGGHVHLLVPIRDWRGQVVGVAGGEVDPAGTRVLSILGEHAGSPATTVDVVDTSGTVVMSTAIARIGTTCVHRASMAAGIRTGLAASGTCRGCHDRQTDSANGLNALVPIRTVSWGICLTVSSVPSLARAAFLRAALSWLGPALLGVGLLFAYGAAQSLLRPVRVLTREAERIAYGHLDQPIPNLGRDELGRLGRTLERMRVALKASIDAIEDANTTLEGRVDARTRELKDISRQLAEREEARARLLRQVITAQEDERKRLARELHDETCQTISALAMRLESAARQFPDGAAPAAFGDARALALRALDELHRLIYDLRPSVLDDLGLWSAIRWYAERQLVARGVAVRCEFPESDRRLPPLVETALFRVSQEAISNIARHAGAEQVLIQGNIRGDTLTIEIEDDGQGFDPAEAGKPSPDGHGWGLLGITERVEAIGGQIDIDTAPGQGVRMVVTVKIPAMER
jgi:signal transduction histidine kinase